ncbi:Uncharacterised protein [Burkholderia pseudomallei]|nr:Uncharacterised protein [Burkholderia pseudomallei]CAJ4673238.1 Uncharacterised protein [Burkholderia pseudomallei]VBM95033.1 Uncharacterised protein [Burkholderia pseudomallei]VBX79348.1 Uncharacterised protein [Burkholderia pseudomallei]VBX79373.1 Uncharacterised protein [Burkholderia pseudomallei]
MYVQFSDSTNTTIVSCFANAQNPAAFPNQGSVSASDARYKTYFNGLPEFAQTLLPPPI